MKGLRLTGLRKAYGGIEVIRGVDLDVGKGEFCVFVGPSGCGKSTLLRMIAGLEEITDGELLIGGQRMNEVDASRRGIAMVFQSYALYPHMTVRENMGFALKFAGVPAVEIKGRVDEASAVLGLDRLMERQPKDLSGGQRQRVAIGRAIVRKPEVFLFDEPLSNLDAELRVNMRIEIARLHRDLGATIVYVTHDQVEAMTLADKIVVLRDGRVEQMGSPLHLYDDPENLFVAGFIGSPRMNLLPATRRGERLVLSEFAGQSIALPRLGTPPVEGEDVTVGIRPTGFRGSGGDCLSVTVEIIEHLGAETLLHARPLGSSRLVTIQRDDGRDVQAGQQIDLRLNHGSVLVFGKDGRRVR